MNKEELEGYINQKLSVRKISKLTGKSYTTIRYWIKKNELTEFKSKIYLSIKEGDFKFCSKCNTTKNKSEFYRRRGLDGGSAYCRICTNSNTIDRCREFKKKCIEYKGNSCIVCGYHKYDGAMEFHHINPEEKDFSISHLKKFSFNHIIKNELDKCILVCANCHREIHAGLVVVPLGIEPRISH